MVLASAGLATLAVVVQLVTGCSRAFSRPNHGASETKCNPRRQTPEECSRTLQPTAPDSGGVFKNTGSATEFAQASNERDRTKHPETPQKACTSLKTTSQKS
jgi:hypothetical protein